MTGSVTQSDGCMLDTTAFNEVVKGELPLSAISGQRLFATHVQLDEINNTRRERTREQLRRTFEEIAAETLPTESAVWDVSKWNQAKWPADDGLFEAMLARLKDLEGEKRDQSNQPRDILIAETAIRKGLILVSDDAKLRTVTIEFGGRAIDREQFMLAACH
jgi:hypothetical protein